MSPSERHDRRYWLKVGVLAAVYIATAKLGLALSVAYGNITPVWAPAGIAIAAVLLFGRSMWVGVAIGAFLANATTDIPLWTAGVIGIGNTLEAVLAGYLLGRVGFQVSLARVRDVLNFVLWAVLAATAVAASFGTTSLFLADQVPNERFGFAWSLWWFGDAMGVLLVGPVVLAWGHARWRPSFSRGLEVVALAVAVVVASSIVFLGGRWTYPHVLFPLMVWSALRFGQRGATLAVFAASAIGIAGTLEGSVPIGGATLVESVQILQLLMGLVAVSTLVLAATITERQEYEEDRLRLHDAEARYRQALELNDTVVQGLAVARMALELDLTDKAEATVVDTLETARSIVSDLLTDVEKRGGLKPGALIRKEPATTGDAPGTSE